MPPARNSVTTRGVVRRAAVLALTACMMAGGGAATIASAAADEAAATGALAVTSDPPGAVVYVDGRYVGETPVQVSHLAAGDHRVRVNKDGYLENGRVINVAGGKSDTVRVRLTARNQAAQDQAAASALKILVLEGEDGVNVVQKKTAVKPTVEVRDRNNLPVSGAAVRFMIMGRQNVADFGGGAREITLTTNSAGRVTASSLRALGNGPFQIQVQATYRGQVATASIAQSNFATVAEAAQAGRAVAGNTGSSAGSAAGSTGSAAAGGGGGMLGLSTPVFAAVAGGAAAAAVAGVAIAKKNQIPTISSVTPSATTGLLAATSTISFTGAATDADSDPLTYSWNFGDGATATGSSTSHTYTTGGSFNVTLTVDDGKGGSVTNNSTTVTIKTLNGTWVSGSTNSTIGPVVWTLTLTQSGAAVAGSVAASGVPASLTNPGNISGTVQSAAPRIVLASRVTGWVDTTFSVDPSADVNTLTGTWAGGSGSTGVTFTRR